MKKYSLFALPVILAPLSILFMSACGGEDQAAPEPAPTRVPGLPDARTPLASAATPAAAPKKIGTKAYAGPPAMMIDEAKNYTAHMEMKKGGTIVIELFPKEAPKTVNNFVFLSREGFYDDVTFHRVIPGFMAQGGDPTGRGTGSPGYKFGSELSPIRRHDGPGVLSMANSGGTNTNGSQFFITFVATPSLDGYDADGNLKPCRTAGVSCHSVFGKVVEGMDVVNAITPRDPGSATGPGDAIKTITIEES